VSHTIVQQHGGSLRAANRDDGVSGARFTVSLPFVDRRSAGRGARAEATAPALPPLVPGEGPARRVLIVDDEEAIRSAMRRALERRGWVVDEAADGREALLKLDVGGRPGEYDAIVSDLRMPGISGIELCEQLSTLHPDLAARTIVITGDTASPAVAKFLATAGRPHLQKPFDMRLLAQLIEHVARSAKPRA
jgi:CheY-like chemotaxis protein